MKTRLVIEEDSVYEIDEECDRARRAAEQKKKEKSRERAEEEQGRGAGLSRISRHDSRLPEALKKEPS